MHYPTTARAPGLKHDPFKALVVPRPIGWIATVDRDGRPNLAPYSFFNGVSDRPPMVMFASAGHKDTLRNVQDTGEFTCSMATHALREAMNLSSAAVAPGVDEFRLAGVTPAPSLKVRPPRVAESPAALECKVWQILPLPAPPARPGATQAPEGYTLVIGEVLAVYIDDAYVTDGIVDTARMQPLARLGYMDYSTVTADVMFTLNRPLASADGQTATVPTAPWDGVYR